MHVRQVSPLALAAALMACSSSSPNAVGAIDASASVPDGAPLVEGGSDAAAPDAGCPLDLSSDPHNCGACGHDCLGATCAASVCAPTTLSTTSDGGVPSVQAVAVDEAGVYWSDESTGGIYALPNGSTAAALVATATSSLTVPTPSLLFAFGGALYWGLANDNVVIDSVAATARGATPTVVTSGSITSASCVTLDESLWLTYREGSLIVPCDGDLWNVSLPAGQATSLGSLPLSGPIVVDPSGRWMFEPSPPVLGAYTMDALGRITLDAEGGTTAGAIDVDYPIPPSKPSVVPGTMAVDAQSLYWLQAQTCGECDVPEMIVAWPLSGGLGRTIVSTLPGVPGSPFFSALTVSGASLFAIGSAPAADDAGTGGEAVWEVPLDGSAPYVLALPSADDLGFSAIAADASYVYFIEPFPNNVAFLRRVAR